MYNKNYILAIIPAYNEEKTIGKVITCIRKYVTDILVVNDGSTDNTYNIANQYEVKIINHLCNMGYGVALQSGYKYAYQMGYKFILQIDGDGQHDASCIPALIKSIETGEADIVIGSRFIQDEKYKEPFLRKIGICFFRGVVSKLINRTITDPTSGFQALNRKVLRLYISDYFPWDYPDADVLLFLHYMGIRFIEIPVRMTPNNSGKSMHNGILKGLYYVFKMSLSIFIVFIWRQKAVGEIDNQFS